MVAVQLEAVRKAYGPVEALRGVDLAIHEREVIALLPFIGLGLAIGYVSGPNSAPAIANLVYLPLSFASGLFVPPNQLPPLVQQIAPYLPTYHAGQLAWATLGASSTSSTAAVAWLFAYALAFFALALLASRREEQQKFS